MSWIGQIDADNADGELRNLYRQIAGPGGQIDNILQAHSLRPHSLAAHMGLYKAVMHHRANRLPKPLAEMIGICVSALNRCEYCVAHHSAGLRRLLDDQKRCDAICAALAAGEIDARFDRRERTALGYATALTTNPSSVDQAMVDALRDAGLDDGEILEINQVVAYFAYANRTVLGLGVSHEGEKLGLAPGSDDPADWGHR